MEPKLKVKHMDGRIEYMTITELRSYGPLLGQMRVEVVDEEVGAYWTRASPTAPGRPSRPTATAPSPSSRRGDHGNRSTHLAVL